LDNYKQSLIRKLKAKSIELRDELSYIQSVYDVAVSDFCSAVCIYCERSKVNNPLLQENPKEKDEGTKNLTPQIKKLFREIAKKTHTDISKSENTREVLEDAVQAKKESKSSNILSIAHELKIDTSNLDYKSIELVESSIKKQEKDISDITNSYPWAWYHAPKNRKDNIIQEFVSSRV
jgi:hypothetical protein